MEPISVVLIVLLWVLCSFNFEISSLPFTGSKNLGILFMSLCFLYTIHIPRYLG